MIFTFIVSAIGGYAAPLVQNRIVDAIDPYVPDDAKLDSASLQVLGFAIVMLGVAILLSLSGAGHHSVMMMLGAVVGRFFPVLQAIFKGLRR